MTSVTKGTRLSAETWDLSKPDQPEALELTDLDGCDDELSPT
jgi:hypothetical protein